MYASTLDVSGEPSSGRSSCNIYWPESEIMNGQKAFTLYSFTLGFFIPFVLILLFYFLVICKLRTVGPKASVHHSYYYMLNDVTINTCKNVIQTPPKARDVVIA